MFKMLFKMPIGSFRIIDDRSRGGDGDLFLGRLLKIIPAEAMIIYPLGKIGSPPNIVNYWPFAVCVIIFFVRLFTTRSDKEGPQFRNIFLSIVMFALWVLLEGDQLGPFSLSAPGYAPYRMWFGLGWIAYLLAAAGATEKGNH